MKWTIGEHRHERNVKNKHSTGSRCGTHVKRGGESDEDAWVRQQGIKDVGNVGCEVVEFRGEGRG